MPDKMTDSEIIKAFTLDDAIKHCYEVADRLCNDCGKEHLQLAKWLEELKTNRDLINRLQAENKNLNAKVGKMVAENKRLKKENTILSQNADTAFQDGLNEAQDLYAEQIKSEIKAKAYNKCIKKVKEIIDMPFCVGFNLLAPLKEALTEYDNGIKRDLNYYLDNLLKELVGDGK